MLVAPRSVRSARSGAKVPIDVWWLVAGERVADVRAGHEGAEAAQRLLVGEQFLEELPERDGGRSWPRRIAIWACACSMLRGVGEPAFVVVRRQQAFRRPALDVRRQLPPEVDAVEEAGTECDARGGEQVGGVAGQQDPTVEVPLDLPSVKVKRVNRLGSPKGRSTPSTRRMLSRSSVTVIGSSSS
jgi:hypothetical protein